MAHSTCSMGMRRRRKETEPVRPSKPAPVQVTGRSDRTQTFREDRRE